MEPDTGIDEGRPWLRSYPQGVPKTLEPYPRASLYSLLEDAARRHPEAVATTFYGGRLSYRRLLREVEAFSGVLASLGVKAGDRVGFVLPNCPQYVIAYYATLRLGAVAVGNNPLYTDRELTHQLADAGVEVCVVLDQLYPKVGRVRSETSIRHVVVTRVTDYMPFPLSLLAPIKLKKEARAEGQPWPPVPAGEPVRWWKRLMAGARAPGPPHPSAPGDLAALVYTGGTTGLSKGAMLTHGNLVANVLQGGAWFPDLTDSGEAVMCLLPFFHSYGMTVCMNVGISRAAKLVLIPRPDLHQTMKLIQKEHVTLFPGVPRLYVAINEAPERERFDLRSIKACLSGAAPLPAAVAARFEEITQGRLVEGYGLTESSPITHANPIDGRAREGSIGLPVPDTDCRIVRLDDWTRQVAPGEPGELIISGPQIMLGYRNRPEESAAVIRTDPDGRRWLLTGDVATMDPDGFFRIVDRKKDMVLVSGFNVYPTAVEDVLYRHPKVVKACVIGIPDDRTGEALKAFLVLRAGETSTPEEIIAFCRDQENGLTAYAVPKQIEFRDELPETLVGKVLRRVLVDEESARRGADA